ncbi:MAG: ferredoxin--NADP reductase [Candidatus Dormibacteraeota bacterium]|nr:ferredoxin--NADP reductase [Candidatus Dormibacteraeota bacterium]
MVSRRDVAADLWVVRIRCDEAVPFRPGQYLTLGLDVEGRVIERPYSVCSAPAEEEAEFFIERVPGGELTEPLYRLQAGAELLVRKRSKGLFLKDAPIPAEPHVFVSTVTGIAPFVSFLRALRAGIDGGDTPAVPILALQGAARSEELAYADELTALADAAPWFRYVPTVSRPWEDPDWRGELGRVEDVLRTYADEAGVRAGHGGVFLCGHPGMISNARAIMRRAGLADAQVREEQYWPD